MRIKNSRLISDMKKVMQRSGEKTDKNHHPKIFLRPNRKIEKKLSSKSGILTN
jgi:hypothetical protein